MASVAGLDSWLHFHMNFTGPLEEGSHWTWHGVTRVIILFVYEKLGFMSSFRIGEKIIKIALSESRLVSRPGLGFHLKVLFLLLFFLKSLFEFQVEEPG